MHLKSFFSPPLYKGNDKKTQQAILLNATDWSIVLLIIFSEVGNMLGGNTPLLVRFLNIIFLGLIGIHLYFLHQDQDQLLPSLNIAVLVLGITYITAVLVALGTVQSATTIAYILPLFLSGLVFGKKGGYLTITVISVTLLVLVALENRGIIIKENQVPEITQWISYTALLVIISNLMLISVRVMERYWKKSQSEIIRRQKTEEVLRIYRYAIEQSPTSIVITDAEGKIKSVNPKFSELTGYREEEVIGENPRIFQSEKYPQPFYKKLWQTISAGKEWQAEIQNEKKNGELYWERISIAPVMDAKKQITHYVAIQEDITPQREALQYEKEIQQRLKDQLQEISALQEKLERQALRDSLTGLHNRHYMVEVLEKEFSHAQRAEHPISIILLDLDHLKKINDTGGHAAGDHALRSIASQLRAGTRKEDTVCRYGGDEFAIILPNTSAEDAFARAQELNKSMKSITLIYRGDQAMSISFTGGVATYPTHGKTSDEIFNYADVALYRAKLKGRNRVELFSVE